MNEYDFELMEFLNEKSLHDICQAQEMFAMFDMFENTKRKYTVHERVDPFLKYDYSEFERRFRMSKQLVIHLYDLLDGRRTLEPLVNIV